MIIILVIDFEPNCITLEQPLELLLEFVPGTQRQFLAGFLVFLLLVLVLEFMEDRFLFLGERLLFFAFYVFCEFVLVVRVIAAVGSPDVVLGVLGVVVH